MKIKFISDYLGRETAMTQYYKGDIVDFSTGLALELIRLDIADEVGQIDVTAYSDSEPVFMDGDVIKKRRKIKDGDE